MKLDIQLAVIEWGTCQTFSGLTKEQKEYLLRWTDDSLEYFTNCTNVGSVWESEGEFCEDVEGRVGVKEACINRYGGDQC